MSPSSVTFEILVGRWVLSRRRTNHVVDRAASGGVATPLKPGLA